MANRNVLTCGWFKVALVASFGLASVAFGAGAGGGAHPEKSAPAPRLSSFVLNGARVWVGFSPNAGAQRLVLATILQARKTVLVQAYSCTNRKIIAALVSDAKRGVKVRVIADKEDPSERDSCIPALLAAHIPVWLDEGAKIAHNKVMIVDSSYVLTGSFNFSWSAAHRNAENVIVIASPHLAKIYTKDWFWRLGHSIRYYGERDHG